MVSLIKKKYMTHPKKIFSKNLKLATWTCLPNMVSLAQGEKIYDLHHMPAKYGEPSSGEKNIWLTSLHTALHPYYQPILMANSCRSSYPKDDT